MIPTETFLNCENNGLIHFREDTPKSEVKIYSYAQLNSEQQQVALDSIAKLNTTIHTDAFDRSKTWTPYTKMIKNRLQECENSKNSLFIAYVGDEFAGYVAFYTKMDKLKCTNSCESKKEAYCSWTAVEEKFRGQNIATALKMKIFETGIHSFCGHIKKDNIASIRVAEKFKNQNCDVSIIDHCCHQIFYRIRLNTIDPSDGC